MQFDAGAALTPGVAHRAAKAELWLRDMDGRGLRPVSITQAEVLVSEGAAYPIVTAGIWKEVRLKVAFPPNSLHPFRGRVMHKGRTKHADSPGSPIAQYQHNLAACRTWKR